MSSFACWIILGGKSHTLGLVPMFDYRIRFIWCLLNHRNKHSSVSRVRFPSSCPRYRAFCSVPVCSQMGCSETSLQGNTALRHMCVSAAKQPGLPEVPAEQHSSLLLLWRVADACGKRDRRKGLASSPSNNGNDWWGIFILYIYSDVWKWALEKLIKII